MFYGGHFRTAFDLFFGSDKKFRIIRRAFFRPLETFQSLWTREQKISNFGLRRPKNSRNLEKAEKLSKMSCFVMAFSGVLEKNQVYRSQKIACGAFCCQFTIFSLKKRRRREKIVFLATFSEIFGVLDLTKNVGFSKIPS
jgi:hypothetical protein